jgi:hypothetical protein
MWRSAMIGLLWLAAILGLVIGVGASLVDSVPYIV